MGCCNSNQIDPEIQKAGSIDELIRIFTEKKNHFKLERTQTKTYQKDKSTEVDGIDLKNLTDKNIEDRIEYLNDLETSYDAVINILSENKFLDVEKTKPYLQNIVAMYYYTYDPNGDLKFAVDELSTFVEDEKKNAKKNIKDDKDNKEDKKIFNAGNNNSQYISQDQGQRRNYNLQNQRRGNNYNNNQGGNNNRKNAY